MLLERTITVPDIFDFTSVDDVSQELRPLIATVSDIYIDGSNVMRVSTAALQFLLTVAKQVQVEGGAVTLSKPSDAFSRAVLLLGLEEEFCRFFKGWQK